MIYLTILLASLPGNGFEVSAQEDSPIEYAPDSVKTSIAKQFQDQYAYSLNTDKAAFKTDGDFSRAELGEGAAVYQVEAEDASLSLKGYEFPLILNREVVGTIEAEEQPEGWTIFNISSQSDLVEHLQEAKRQAGSNGTVQYVHDQRYAIRGFYVRDQEQEFFLDLNTNRVSDRESFEQWIRTFDTDSPIGQAGNPVEQEEIQVGGSSVTADSPKPVLFLQAAAAAVLVFAISGLLYARIKKNRA